MANDGEYIHWKEYGIMERAPILELEDLGLNPFPYITRVTLDKTFNFPRSPFLPLQKEEFGVDDLWNPFSTLNL